MSECTVHSWYGICFHLHVLRTYRPDDDVFGCVYSSELSLKSLFFNLDANFSVHFNVKLKLTDKLFSLR